MGLESIAVTLLTLGVLALLAWFEINSRKNARSKHQEPETLPPISASPNEPPAGNRHAA